MMHFDESAFPKPLFNIVLVEPEIPNNTGNIGRLCVGLQSRLHIVGEPAFEISDKRVKRAGLDYWVNLDLKHHTNMEAFIQSVEDSSRVFMLTTKAGSSIYERAFRPGDYFVFGKETKGLSEDDLARFPSQNLGLPMIGPVRSQNVANVVSVVMYEGLRQVLAGPI